MLPMSMVFAKKHELETIIQTYILGPHDNHHVRMDQFRNALVEVLNSAQLREEHVYDPNEPLIMLVGTIKKKHNIPDESFIRQLTTTYVNTLKTCLGAQTPFAPNVLPFAKATPVAKEQSVIAIEEVIEAPLQESLQSPVEEVAVTQPEEKKSTLTQEHIQQLHDLYTTWHDKKYIDVIWSQVASMDGIKEVMDRYQMELQRLIEQCTLLQELPIPQLKVYHKELTQLSQECKDMIAKLKTIHPMQLKSSEQQSRQKFVKKCIDTTNRKIRSIFEELVAKKGWSEYWLIKSTPVEMHLEN